MLTGAEENKLEAALRNPLNRLFENGGELGVAHFLEIGQEDVLLSETAVENAFVQLLRKGRQAGSGYRPSCLLPTSFYQYFVNKALVDEGEAAAKHNRRLLFRCYRDAGIFQHLRASAGAFELLFVPMYTPGHFILLVSSGEMCPMLCLSLNFFFCFRSWIGLRDAYGCTTRWLQRPPSMNAAWLP
jgi:hypothetical protein